MKKVLLGFVAASPFALLAEGETVTIPTAATNMFTTATSFISGIESPLSAMLVAAFGVVLIFVAYKLAKRGINKV